MSRRRSRAEQSASRATSESQQAESRDAHAQRRDRERVSSCEAEQGEGRVVCAGAPQRSSMLGTVGCCLSTSASRYCFAPEGSKDWSTEKSYEVLRRGSG